MPKHIPTKILPSREYLRACLDYDPASGELRWKKRPQEHFIDNCEQWNGKLAGKIAGTVMKNGYRQIFVNDSPLYAHRIIWKWMTGEEPPSTIDHKDNNRGNNRWDNLRAATQSQQNLNRSAPTNNTSGYKCVIWNRKQKKWRMQIITKNFRIFRNFDTAEEAAAAYETAARKLHGEFYHD